MVCRGSSQALCMAYTFLSSTGLRGHVKSCTVHYEAVCRAVGRGRNQTGLWVASGIAVQPFMGLGEEVV